MNTRNTIVTLAVVAIAVSLAVYFHGTGRDPKTAAVIVADAVETPRPDGTDGLPRRGLSGHGPDGEPGIVPPTFEPGPSRSRQSSASVNPDQRGMDLDNIMALDPESLRHLVATAEPVTAQAAVWQMGNRMSLSADDVDTLLARLQTSNVEDVDLRKTIIWALSLRPDLMPVDSIAAYAATDPVPEVRRAAIRTISTVKQPIVVETLYRSATLDNSAQNRSESATYLALHVDDKGAQQAVASALKSESDLEVQRSWLNVLGSHPSEENVAVLRQIMDNPNEDQDLRQASAEMLIESGTVSLGEVLSSTDLSDGGKDQLQAMYAPAATTAEPPEDSAGP